MAVVARMPDCKGHVIQVFADHEYEIYRIFVGSGIVLNPGAISVMSRRGIVECGAIVLEENVNGGSILSLTLPAGIDSFSVLQNRKTLARLGAREKRLLCIERDLRMVNPGIDGAYHEWLRIHEASVAEARRTALPQGTAPLISIVVPLYETPIRYLHDLLDSVLAQTYKHWELVLVNASPENTAIRHALNACKDERFKIIEVEANLGIAGNTNVGIRAATGDFVAFCDHDDMLDPRILEMYVRAIAQSPTVDLLYCDEDNFHESLADRYAPRLKPDFVLDLLHSHNYVVHMLTVSRWALERVQLSPDDRSGAQDYDLTLKISEVARSIVHVPYILYHWRAHPGSTNGGVMDSKPYAINASVLSLDAHYRRQGIRAHAKPTDIPCVFSSVYEPCRQNNVSEVVCPKGSSIAETLNRALQGSVGDYILAMRADVKISNFAVNQLVSRLSQREDLGIAAPKLYYRDGLVAHAGVAFSRDGEIVLLNQNFCANMGGGYFGFAECSCNYSAVGPECFVVRTSLLRDVGGMDDGLENDLLSVIDLCLRLRERNLKILVAPEAAGVCSAPISYAARTAVEAYGPSYGVKVLSDRWKDALRHDVLENPGVSLATGYPVLDIGRNIELEAQRLLGRSRTRELIGRIVRHLRRA